MRCRRFLTSSWWSVGLLLLVAGCGSQEAAAPPSMPDGPTDQPASDALPESESPSAPTSAAPHAGAEKSAQVVLGAAELTAGIPGEGPLTVEQIQAWLDDPQNHQTLTVSLPLGLSDGQGQIKGLEANPLTRAKIELGRQLYFDGRLSADASVSCATCHDPDHGFAAPTRFGEGIGGQTGNRNSPVAHNRILSDAQFWDGRADSLEAQAVGPIANPIEMGNTHTSCVECVKGIPGYALQFERIFPDGVTIENVGSAIASFERAIVTGPSPFDYYEVVRTMDEQLGADGIEDLREDDPELYAKYTAAQQGSTSMSDSAKRGRALFFSNRVGCTACHVGANLTDEKYHNLGVGLDRAEPDLGRFMITNDPKDRGAFKTPTIRNVAQTAPYMHDGSQQTLIEVVKWYAQGGHPNPQLSDKIKKLDLTEQEQLDLVAFMEACTGPLPVIERGRLPE